MAKIDKRTQGILESMIVDKFKDKRNVLSSELDAIKERDRVIISENKDKCRDSIVRVMCKAQNDIMKILKNAGLEIGNGYDCSNIICLFDCDCELRKNWDRNVIPIAKKNPRQLYIEENLKELDNKRRKAIDELVLRATLGCKYNEVMDFINNLEV